MDTNKNIRCIFCGSLASIRKLDKVNVVSCPSCQRKTELDAYQEVFDQWIDEIRNEE